MSKILEDRLGTQLVNYRTVIRNAPDCVELKYLTLNKMPPCQGIKMVPIDTPLDPSTDMENVNSITKTDFFQFKVLPRSAKIAPK